MHNRKKLIGIVVCAIIAAAAACGDSATAPTSAPEFPLYDGGGWIGSGNRNDSTTIKPASATTDSSSALGGGWIGSGN